MSEKNAPEIEVEWLDWLSTKGERNAKRNKYCTFAGMSMDIPDEIKTRLGITKYPASYCIIHEA